MNIIQNINNDDFSKFKAFSLLNLPKSSFYYKPIFKDESDLANEVYEIWCKYQFYGYRKVAQALRENGREITYKKTLKIMQELGIYSMTPGPHTSKPGKQKIKLPFLLKDLEINKPHIAWQTDITYIKIPGGFVYLLAFIDYFSRYIIDWKISNCMDVFLATETLQNAMSQYKPEIINTDQGSQFTSNDWLEMLKNNSIKPSMTAQGRCIDNVRIERFWRSLKYEEIYLNPPDDIKELRENIEKYIDFYNNKRHHQALQYKTPAEEMKTQLKEE